MFLDDKLLEIGRKVNLTDETDVVYEAISKMIQACMDNIYKNVKDLNNIQAYKSSFRRVNNTWESVAKILHDEGHGFVRLDGFYRFVKSKDDLKDLME